MDLHESGEMYLETLYILSQEKDCVRSLDLAEQMGYSKPSVSRAVGILKNNGYIYTDNGGCLYLTDKGEEIAFKIYQRHVVLMDMLSRLGVSTDTAAKDACRIEHVISDETFDAIRKYMRDTSPAGSSERG